jgi:hypothetical protein
MIIFISKQLTNTNPIVTLLCVNFRAYNINQLDKRGNYVSEH